MTHVITTYGGGELFALVFNGIAALFSTKGGILIPLMNVSLTVGAVYVVILMLFRSSLAEGLHWLLWVIVATNLIFLPKTTIYIHDPLMHTRTKVDHVPFALGAFAGLLSQVGKTITERFESVFTLPNYMPYHQTGTVFASSLMSQVGQFRIVDPEFKGNMERFVNQCVVYNAMMGQKYTLKDLQNTPDIWSLVKSNASPILGFLYKEGNNQGRIITCKEGAIKLEALWTKEIDNATATYGSVVQNQKLTKSAFFTHLQNGYQLLTNISGNATKILQQEMMINALEESSNNKLSELGAPSNYAATKALLQQRSAYAIAGEIAARTLPLFKNVIEALSYSLFIFIVVLALLPSGYRVLMTYFGILVWTQLWAPLYAVLNLVMTLYGKGESMGQGFKEGLTLLNSSAVINANTDMVTLAAWLSVSIPFISYGILKQGAAAFVGLAHHLGSAMQSSASSAAAETVSGNISLGNVSMGTEAYQNTNAFQHNTSPTHSSSHFRATNTSGVEQSTFADGTQSFTDQALSKLGVEIIGTENTSFAQQENLNHAKSIAETKSRAANDATDASLSETTNFLSQVGKVVSSGEDWSKSQHASEAESLQKFNNFVEDIRKSNHLTKAEAMEVAVAAKLGMEYMGFGGGVNLSTSQSETFQKAVDSAKNLAKQNQYGDNLEKIVSAAQSVSENTTDTKLKELGRGVTSTLNHAKGLRDESSIAKSEVDTLSKDLSSSQSQSFIISKNLTQDILEFIAHQPVNKGPDQSPGQVGPDQARLILDGGGAERATYIQRFKETHPQYRIQSIHSAQEEGRLDHSYAQEANKLQKNFDSGTYYQQQKQVAVNEGTRAGLDPHPLTHGPQDVKSTPLPQCQHQSENSADAPKQPQSVKNAAEEFIVNVEKKIQAGKKEIINQQKPLQTEASKMEDSVKKTPTSSSIDSFNPPMS